MLFDCRATLLHRTLALAAHVRAIMLGRVAQRVASAVGSQRGLDGRRQCVGSDGVVERYRARSHPEIHQALSVVRLMCMCEEEHDENQKVNSIQHDTVAT